MNSSHLKKAAEYIDKVKIILITNYLFKVTYD